MNHLTEEELIEQICSDDHEVAADSHLNTCAQCAREFAALRNDLDKKNFAELPERDTSFGLQVWASISESLPVYQSRKHRWFGNRPLLIMSYAAAFAIMLLCAFAGGRHWERRQSSSTVAKTVQAKPPQSVKSSQRVVVVVLSDHLDRSERLLVELKHADAENSGLILPLKDEARNLLKANRICRQNLKHDDDPDVAKALDHLDHLLVQIANQTNPLNNETIARLQKELNADGLLFEVRVLRSRQPQSPAEMKGSTI